MKTAVESNRRSKAVTDAAAHWIARREAGLSVAEGTEFNAWLTADPRHRAAFDQLDAGWKKLDRPFEAGAADQLLVELDSRRRRRRRRRFVSAAAAVALLMVVGSIWQRQSSSTRRPPVVVQPARQTLPDGSTIELKPAAEVAVSYSPKMRRVTLKRGEAHFTVAKDFGRAFIVTAGGVEIRAVGTAFSVDHGETNVEVIVTEGKVEVEKSSIQAGATEQVSQPIATVEAGNRVVVEIAQPVATSVSAVSETEMAARQAWRAPRVEFTGTPLAEAVEILNQHSASRQNIRFVVGDPAIAGIRVSGLFRVDNTDAFVRLLQNGFGIEAEHRGESEIVLRRAK